MKVFYADSDKIDNSHTGYYTTADEARDAFRCETLTFLFAREVAEIEPTIYVRSEEVTDDLRERAEQLAADGSPSPALGIDVTV
jgi:hypothetical protein